MSELTYLDLKEKAKDYLIKNRLDYLLCHMYLSTQYFTSWSEQEDFGSKWNIGLKNINSETRILECGHLKEPEEFLTANFEEISFKIGGHQNYYSMPDGEVYTTLSISLIIDDKVVLSAEYSGDPDYAYSASDWHLVGVEELHADSKLKTLLEGIEREIKKNDEKKEHLRKEEENNLYKNKFTFNDVSHEPKSKEEDRFLYNQGFKLGNFLYSTKATVKGIYKKFFNKL